MTEKYKNLVKKYRKLAKRADQRMVRLEKLEKTEGYNNVTKYAYKRAAKDIEHYGVVKKLPRWNTKPPANINSLKAKIADIETFLNSATSTKSGINKLYLKRAETLKKEYGVDYTWRELANFFQSKTWENLSSKLGSKTAIKTIGKIQDNKEKILDNIDKEKERVIITDDWKTEKTVNQMLSDNDIKISDLFGSD